MSLTAFRVHPDVFDKGLEEIKTLATKRVACSQEPTTVTEADSTFKVAEATGLVAGDWTIANGDEAGNQPRKITGAQVVGEGTANGGVAWEAWLDLSGSPRLLLAKPASLAGGESEVGVGNPVTFPASKLELMAGERP